MPHIRPRILCLHGFTSNGAVHAHQSRRIIKLLPEYEFIFPDGPHLVEITSQMDLGDPASKLWSDMVNSLSTSGHRAWWYAKEYKEKESGEFSGLEQTLDYLASFVRQKGPFHAVWGFSQGGCLAGILCALQEGDHPLKKHLPPGLFAFKAGIMFSGFRARFPQYDAMYAAGIHIPTMHVMGLEDDNVAIDRSEALIQICQDPVLLKHDGGHNVPKSEQDHYQVAEFLRKHIPGKGTYRQQASI